MVTLTRARGQKRRGGVSSSHYVLHVKRGGFEPANERTLCGRRAREVNCTADQRETARLYRENRDELCRICANRIEARNG